MVRLHQALHRKGCESAVNGALARRGTFAQYLVGSLCWEERGRRLLAPPDSDYLLEVEDRASLNGTVTDPTGARVPGVKVEAILAENGKQREALTNDAGIYAIPTLPVGTSTISPTTRGSSARD